MATGSEESPQDNGERLEDRPEKLIIPGIVQGITENRRFLIEGIIDPETGVESSQEIMLTPVMAGALEEFADDHEIPDLGTLLMMLYQYKVEAQTSDIEISFEEFIEANRDLYVIGELPTDDDYQFNDGELLIQEYVPEDREEI